MNKPCAIGWCVALAEKDRDLCRIHMKRPGYKPQPYRKPKADESKASA